MLITRLAIACVTAVFGNAFSKWFLNTKAGAWFQKKLDAVLEFLQKRYDIEVAKKEVKWRRDYPLLAKRIDNLEAKLEGYEQWAKKLDE